MNIRKQLGKSRFHRFYLVMLMSGQESFNSSSLFLRPILGHSQCFRPNLNHSKKGFSASFWDGGVFIIVAHPNISLKRRIVYL